ncbi:bacterial surface proteins containing Ig-like domains [Clostridium sp. CAG:253]|jgi:hypothetical protein|nr:bacterial surface proteins containing Ig-like domains [Clostridium sp. CAG:253]
MRKQTKKILSIVMSAALAITAGAGINLTKSSAADTKPNFKAALWSYGTFADWAGAASDTVEVSDFGEYTLTGEATKDLDDLFKSDNGTAVVLGKYADLTAAGLGTTYEVVGKSIQVNDGEVIPWNVTPVNWDDDARMVIRNAWNADIDFKTDKVAPIKTGDKIKVTFEVKAKDGSGDASTPGAIETPAPAGAPTDADLVGTAQLDSQANGWCGNEDCTNVKADIKGAGTYTVSSTWEEVQEDPQAYCALTIADLKDIAAYVTFKDVTVWVDGKVVNMPVVYGGDKDCRIQLWNTWGNDGVGAGFEVPANFPSSFYEIKVQFTIGLRDTARDWDAEGTDSSLINIDTTQPDYEPANKPAEPTPAPADPTPAPTTKPSTTKNAVKSLKAAKKTVSVKKGKKADVTVKVTAASSKKKTTDKVTATTSNKKVAKVVKTTVKAGKIVVSVKGVKKGTAKITVKAAKKKAVVTVKVK